MVPWSLRNPNWETIILPSNQDSDKAAKFSLPHIRILGRGKCEDKNQGWFTTPSRRAAGPRLLGILALSLRLRLTTGAGSYNRSSGFTVDKFTNWQSSLRGNRSHRSPEMSGMQGWSLVWTPLGPLLYWRLNSSSASYLNSVGKCGHGYSNRNDRLHGNSFINPNHTGVKYSLDIFGG